MKYFQQNRNNQFFLTQLLEISKNAIKFLNTFDNEENYKNNLLNKYHLQSPTVTLRTF